MIVVEDGVRKINLRWRRNLFQWEKEMVDICSGLVLGARRDESEIDFWKWREESYTVKEVYQVLIEGGGRIKSAIGLGMCGTNAFLRICRH
jgi:hypothetical protein